MGRKYNLTKIFELVGIEPYENMEVEFIAETHLNTLSEIIEKYVDLSEKNLYNVLSKLEYCLQEDLLNEEEKDLVFYVVSYLI